MVGNDELTDFAKINSDSDSCGFAEKGHHLLLWITTRKGLIGMPYGGLQGVNVTKKGFALHFHAALDFGDGEQEGMWKATVDGRNLDIVLMHIGKGSRVKLYESGKVEGEKAEVTQIDIEPWG